MQLHFVELSTFLVRNSELVPLLFVFIVCVCEN